MRHNKMRCACAKIQVHSTNLYWHIYQMPGTLLGIHGTAVNKAIPELKTLPSRFTPTSRASKRKLCRPHTSTYKGLQGICPGPCTCQGPPPLALLLGELPTVPRKLPSFP